jgi:hypothetical protein
MFDIIKRKKKEGVCCSKMSAGANKRIVDIITEINILLESKTVTTDLLLYFSDDILHSGTIFDDGTVLSIFTINSILQFAFLPVSDLPEDAEIM